MSPSAPLADDSVVASNSFVIAYCHGGTIHTWFHQSLQRLILHDITNRKLWRGEIAIEGLYIAWSRNKVVEEFLAAPRPVDWLLMLDTDMTFQPQTAYALIDSATDTGAAIMSALYFGYCSTNAPGKLLPVWYEEAPDDSPTEIKTVGTINTRGPQQLAGVGMGCCLIHREVFATMQRELGGEWPWFQHDLGRDNGRIRQMGEDLSFCKRAAQLGFTTWGDSRIQCGHIKKRVENWDTWEATQPFIETPK